jgi:integrase
LENMTKDELNYSISRFICEVKKKNGDDYPGETLHELVISLQLHFDLKGKPLKFLNDPDFMQLKNTLDGVMKDRAKAGLGIRRKQAQVITLEEEEILWQKNVLGSSNPTQLLNTVVYLIGLNFALRGGQEHRNLRWKNARIQLLTDQKTRKVKAKEVDAYENKKDRSRCIVTLFKKYIYHCPPEDKRPDAFYLRPLAKPNGSIWYACQPIGQHKLANVVAEVCKKGGLQGHRTNHSLRATAASRLYDQNIDEQLICEVTGHRSNAVRNYKRTTTSLKRQVNSVVQGLKVARSSETGIVPTYADQSADGQINSCTSTFENDDKGGKHISLTLNLNI